MANDVGQQMGATDALMLRLERSALLRSTIVQVAILDHAPDAQRLRDKVLQGTAKVARFRQVPVPTPIPGMPPTWVGAADFDVDYHLRFSRLRKPSGMWCLLDEAALIGVQVFDPARPLWESHIIEGLPDDRAAAIQKIHHALGDGVSLLDIAMLFLDLERDPVTYAIEVAEPLLDFSSALARATSGLNADAQALGRTLLSAAAGLANFARHPSDSAASLTDTAKSLLRIAAPGSGQLSPIMRGRSFGARFDALVVPLDEMKAAGRHVGGKLNTAFLAAVAGGLDRYHHHHGAPVAGLRCAMPVTTRDAADKSLGNHFSPTRFVLPMTAADPIERLQAARELTESQQHESALNLTGPMARTLALLPSTLLVPAVEYVMRGIDVIVSNVRGAPLPVYVAGARSLANFGFAPRGGAALNITMISNMDEIHVAVNSDPEAIPDPVLLMACLQESFDEIRKVA